MSKRYSNISGMQQLYAGKSVEECLRLHVTLRSGMNNEMGMQINGAWQMMLDAATKIDALKKALEAYEIHGCPICNADCAGAPNPPYNCPVQLGFEAKRL